MIRRWLWEKIGVNSLPLVLGVGLAAVLIALLVALEGTSLPAVSRALYDGAWADVNARVRVVTFWMPLLLCCSGLLLTFSAGLWNIGVEGQLAMGAVGASLGALFLRYDSRELQLAVQLGLALAGGAGWGLLAGVLKTRGGINEIFGGVALNFIAALFIAYLIGGPWAPPQAGTGSRTAPFDPFTLLPVSDFNPRYSPLMVYLGLGLFVGVALILTFSRFGLQLKAIGKSEASARALGVPTERNLWLSMALCGGLAGLAGGVRVLHVGVRALQANATGGVGFLAILVVLLVTMRWWLVPLVSFAFSFMITGGLRLESSLQLDSALVNVVQGILVLSVLLFEGVRARWQARQEAKSILPETSQGISQTLEFQRQEVTDG